MPLHPALVPLAVAAVLLAGCGAPKGTVPEVDAQGRYVIRMTDQLQFDPAEARVPAGATVVWLNVGQEPHDVAGYYGDPEDGTEDLRFQSPRLPNPEWSVPAGQSYNATVSEEGLWTIWCHRHHESRMKGTIHVE